MTDKVINYKVVKANSVEELNEIVMTYIDDGWQPSGIMVVDKTGYAQQILKYEKEQVIEG